MPTAKEKQKYNTELNALYRASTVTYDAKGNPIRGVYTTFSLPEKEKYERLVKKVSSFNSQRKELQRKYLAEDLKFNKDRNKADCLKQIEDGTFSFLNSGPRQNFESAENTLKNELNLDDSDIRSVNDYVRFENILQERKVLKDFGFTKLHFLAAINGHIPIATYFKNNPEGAKAELTQADAFGNTPLHIALQLGLVDVVRELLTQAKNHNKLKEVLAAKDADGHNVFHLSAVHASKDRSKALYLLCFTTCLDAMKEIDSTNTEMTSALNAQSNHHLTPLHMATLAKNNLIVGKLLDEKADPMIADKDGMSALHYAGALGRKKVFQTIVEKISQEELLELLFTDIHSGAIVELEAASSGGYTPDDLDFFKIFKSLSREEQENYLAKLTPERKGHLQAIINRVESGKKRQDFLLDIISERSVGRGTIEGGTYKVYLGHGAFDTIQFHLMLAFPGKDNQAVRAYIRSCEATHSALKDQFFNLQVGMENFLEEPEPTPAQDVQPKEPEPTPAQDVEPKTIGQNPSRTASIRAGKGAEAAKKLQEHNVETQKRYRETKGKSMAVVEGDQKMQEAIANATKRQSMHQSTTGNRLAQTRDSLQVRGNNTLAESVGKKSPTTPKPRGTTRSTGIKEVPGGYEL